MGEIVNFVNVDKSYPRVSEDSPYRQKSGFEESTNTWNKVHETSFPENLFVDYDFLEFSGLFKHKLAEDKDSQLAALGNEICDKYAYSLCDRFHEVGYGITCAIIRAWTTMARNEPNCIEDDKEIIDAMFNLIIGHEYIMRHLLEMNIVQYKKRNKIQPILVSRKYIW